MTKPSLPSLKPVVTNVASTSFNLSPSKWVTHSWRRMLNSSSSLRGELAYQDLSASPPRQGASYESTISHRAAVLVLFVPDCFCRGAENEPFKDCPDFRPSQRPATSNRFLSRHTGAENNRQHAGHFNCGVRRSFPPYQQGRDSGVGSSQFRDLLRCGRHTEDNCGSFKPQCKN